MVWICQRCGYKAKIVFTTKVADNFRIFVGDVCIRCIRQIAEGAISMSKMDMISPDLGYTKAALEEGALQLMKCGYCKQYRSEILLGPNEMCCSCFLYFYFKG
jgi:protein-arginine kinase activator protein McsA